MTHSNDPFKLLLKTLADPKTAEKIKTFTTVAGKAAEVLNDLESIKQNKDKKNNQHQPKDMFEHIFKPDNFPNESIPNVGDFSDIFEIVFKTLNQTMPSPENKKSPVSETTPETSKPAKEDHEESIVQEDTVYHFDIRKNTVHHTTQQTLNKNDVFDALNELDSQALTLLTAEEQIFVSLVIDYILIKYKPKSLQEFINSSDTEFDSLEDPESTIILNIFQTIPHEILSQPYHYHENLYVFLKKLTPEVIAESLNAYHATIGYLSENEEDENFNQTLDVFLEGLSSFEESSELSKSQMITLLQRSLEIYKS